MGRDRADASGALLTRGLATLIVVLGMVAGACTGSTNQGAPAAGSSGSSSLSVPLPPWDQEAFRQAEANLRRDGRAQAGLAQLGPGALEFAALMDRTASFLLVQLPDALKAAVPGGSVTLARSTGSGSTGRLAAPLIGLQPPGAPTLGTYIMTTQAFDTMISGQTNVRTGGVGVPNCPCTETSTEPFTTDEVTVGGNTGTITTTMTATATVYESKVSLDVTLKVEGEVRDAGTGAVLYKISNEYTGHADGDACPDASGIARAHMLFGGNETYFDASGAKSGSGVTESFGGELRIKADDNAKLAGVDLTTTGKGADFLMRQAAQGAAPAFEKGWQSGVCIAVLVTPEGGDVDPDSVTTVTVKVKHKIEGTELDKPVEALFAGVKSIEPAPGTKQKAPATFRYTAGSAAGDQGSMYFQSVSNRGIGTSPSVAFTVGGGWTISSVGTSNEGFQGVIANALQVSIKDLKLSAGKDNALSGSGTITLTGPLTAGMASLGELRGNLDQTIPFTASGVLVGTGPGALLRLTLNTAAPADAGTTLFTGPMGVSVPIPNQGYSDRYGETLGQFDLPAAAGTTTISRTAAIGGVMNVSATGTFTVVRSKP